ncbi:MAG: HAD family hydrolase [Myxococcota bacterium]
MNASPATSVAFFDVDRTLVRVNTANLYLKWRYRRGETSTLAALRAVGWLIQYRLGVVDAERAYELALRPMRGRNEEEFRGECRQWYQTMVREHITDAARADVSACRDAGLVCALLTAGTEYAATPLAEELGIEHILCTRLEVIDGYFTGAFERPLCYGQGKVEVASRWVEAHGIALEDCSFYSDSVSDIPMLERVGEPRVINPDPRLTLRARSEGWPVAYWR